MKGMVKSLNERLNVNTPLSLSKVEGVAPHMSSVGDDDEYWGSTIGTS